MIKVGTSLIDHEETRFNYPLVFDLARQIKRLHRDGVQVVLVSSGAVGSGMREMGESQYPSSIERKQALAAIGQPFLMHQYGDVFSKFGLRKAQVLLTRDGLENRSRYLHARDCIEELLGLGVVPIVNENDTVAVQELRIGDNDQLSAVVAAKISAGLLIILTDVDGLYTRDPRTNPDAQLVPVVAAVTPKIMALAGGKGSVASTGGMHTKLLAARLATAANVLTCITCGRRTNVILDLMAGQGSGTWFLPGTHSTSGRRRWMAGKHPAGTVVVDEGAVRALVTGGRSLLPVGVRQVKGPFKAGDVIRITDPAGQEIALGQVSYSSTELDQVKGRSSAEIRSLLGRQRTEIEVIHRDNMVLL